MTQRLSDIHNKADLFKVLYSLRMAAVYDLFGQTLLHQFYKEVASGIADAHTLIAILPEGEITLQQFNDQLNEIDTRALVETKRNANRALTRNLFKESFRITHSYCKKSAQLTVLEAQSWYRFARIIANSLSHDFLLKFGKYDIPCLPVTYKDETIDRSLEGKPISGTLDTLLNLNDELIAFSKIIH